MPAPQGSETNRCAMQRGIFSNDAKAGRKWIKEFGDQ